MAASYYVILGVPPDADSAQIRRAYRRLCHECHPDRDPSGAARFIQIKGAYDALSDAARRTAHDRTLRQHPRPSAPHVGPSAPINILRDFETQHPSSSDLRATLERNFTGRHQPKSQPLQELRIDIPFSQAEALRGGTLTLCVPVLQPCPACAGTGGGTMQGCNECEGRGSRTTDARVDVIVPSRTPDGTTIPVSLRHLGVYSLMLQLRVLVSSGSIQ